MICATLNMNSSAQLMQYIWLLLQAVHPYCNALVDSTFCHLQDGNEYNLLFFISDILALWYSALSARVPECQKLKM